MEVSQSVNARNGYAQNFTALKIDPDMCAKTMDNVVNNIEILKLTKMLHDVGQDLYVRELPANLDMHSLEQIPARISLLIPEGNGYFKTLGRVLSDKVKDISADEIFSKLFGKPVSEKQSKTLLEKVDEFNKLLD